MASFPGIAALAAASMMLSPSTAAAPIEPAWAAHAREAHAHFTGQAGTFAMFGDSITDTMAFWAPLAETPKNMPPDMAKAVATVREYMRPECWRAWKGPEYGNQSGQTARWALDNVETWLRKLNPEVAVILFGTNDLRDVEAPAYRTTLQAVVQKCLANGTVPILTALPPRHGYEAKSAAFAEADREIARNMRVPLIDFYAEIMRRRPADWDGALPQFSAYQDYDVPTLISRDGVHPSFPTRYQNDYSGEALRSCGYGLRNYLTAVAYAQVIAVLRDRPKAALGAVLTPPDQPWFHRAPPLPAPAGKVVRVSSPDGLYHAVEQAAPGETILLADGHYLLPQPFEIKADNVTLRGASGRRERVILDGGNIGELVKLTACTAVTIADLTVQNVKWNGIKLNSETGVQRARIYNCILHNIWQRFVKGVLVPQERRDQIRPSGCRVEYCLFYNDRPKQFTDDEADTAENFGGNYIGGIDVMYARGWIIHDNVFIGIHGRTGEARGAVFLWHEALDCVVERNVIVDCDSGICLGNSFKREDTPYHARGCIVRNNFVTRAHENGILADYTRDCAILNNSIYDPESRLGRLIRIVHDAGGLVVANNLVCGPHILNESNSHVVFERNLVKDISAALVAPAEGDLHLTSRASDAIGHALRLAAVRDDIDHHPRGTAPDIGAHELRQAAHGLSRSGR